MILLNCVSRQLDASRFKHFKNIGIFLIAIVLASYLIILIMRAAVNVPFKDEWVLLGELAPKLAKGTLPSFPELLAALNGHPYLLLKLLISITLITHAPWSWMMYAQVLLLFLAFLIISQKFLTLTKGKWLAALAVVIILLSPRQWENLYWAMQITFAIALVAGFSSFYFVSKYRDERRSAWLILGLSLGLIASINSGFGFPAFLVALITLLILRPSRRDLIFILFFGTAGVGLFLAAQILSTRVGIGREMPPFTLLVKHALLMLANSIAFYPQGWYIIGLLLGLAVTSLTLYCIMVAITMRQNNIFFEMMSIVWSLVLVMITTYTRLSMGIFQPDASRYVPLVAPLIVGCSLILAYKGKREVLTTLLILLAVGYLQSAESEWRTTPYRKENLTRSLLQFCTTGIVEDSRIKLTPSQTGAFKKFFCSSRLYCTTTPPTYIIKWDDLLRSGQMVSGFYCEEDKVWVGPLASIVLRPRPEDRYLHLEGYVPDITLYSGRRLVVQICCNNKTTGDQILGEAVIEESGFFHVKFSMENWRLSAGEDVLITLRSTLKQHPPGSEDKRELSFVFLSIYFAEE